MLEARGANVCNSLFTRTYPAHIQSPSVRFSVRAHRTVTRCCSSAPRSAVPHKKLKCVEEHVAPDKESHTEMAVKRLQSSSALLPVVLAAAAPILLWCAPALALDNSDWLTSDYLGGGYISAFLLILFSEIGDKTFFIAVLLSLQNSRSLIFTGTFGALAIMTVISVAIGQSFHELDGLIPENAAQFPLDDILAAALLIVFGIQTLLAARNADDNAEEEQNEAQEVVSGLSAGSGSLVLTTFGLVFAAEWGDKSFLATAALSAASSPLGVCLGAIAGHAVATAIAVLGGSFLSKYISERNVQYVGGSLFLVFAFGTLVDLYSQVQS